MQYHHHTFANKHIKLHVSSFEHAMSHTNQEVRCAYFIFQKSIPTQFKTIIDFEKNNSDDLLLKLDSLAGVT